MTKILTGLQPSGTLHIGNYLGSILNWHDTVNEVPNAQAFLTIVDLHAITIKQNPDALRQQIYELAAVLLASGVDYKRHVVFPQSANPDHTYAGWLYTCITPMGWLDRMTQFKEKKQKTTKYKESVGAGLYAYPTLMAADILLYDADLVPVGIDQKQHVELTCDIANRFNSLYGETFRIPEFKTNKETTKIFDLQHPEKKMSKSDQDDAGRISLTDSSDQIRKKIMRAVTDDENEVRFDSEKKPGISNLLVIMAAVTGRKKEDIATEFRTAGYGAFKGAVAEAVITYLSPVQQKMRDYLNDIPQLQQILDEGAARAHSISHPKVLEAVTKMGLYLHG